MDQGSIRAWCEDVADKTSPESPANTKSLGAELSKMALATLGAADITPPQSPLLHGAPMSFFEDLIDLGHEFAAARSATSSRDETRTTCGVPPTKDSTSKYTDNEGIISTRTAEYPGPPGLRQHHNHPVWNLGMVRIARYIAMAGLISMFMGMAGKDLP
ncbi:hypothetical protein K490DRAFT_65694 [Saccharata proteae CBS 121410]|uniref:Uncharacterized protein n=1 Tax=Saccharata proteae CBS 121410 TaxID=1314787 RepID=A0A9P4LYN8_9PEZI|nr:hypothetical protein K490DRAFT_65694 [Saccharata proteae CBS 121410]